MTQRHCGKPSHEAIYQGGINAVMNPGQAAGHAASRICITAEVHGFKHAPLVIAMKYSPA